MSNLHAQLALFGAIDEVVTKTNNPEIVAIAEKFLPGTTGPGQRGWYGELKQFLSQEQLQPRDDDGGVIPRPGAVQLPDFRQALSELTAPAEQSPPGLPPDIGAPGPDVVQRSLFASMILAQMAQKAPAQQLPIAGWDPVETDPLNAIVPLAVRPSSSDPFPFPNPIPQPLPPGPIAGAPPPPPPPPGGPEGPLSLRDWLLGVQDREAYANVFMSVGPDQIDPSVAFRPLPCTGALRKVGGQFCSVLTTDWLQPLIGLDQMTSFIDPQNWPLLCKFFVRMTQQDAQNPDMSRGWSRVLETVSGDPTQWEMRTALRFWKGVSPTGAGVFLNYDLDSPRRVNDDKLVEVDSGYIWITPIDPAAPEKGVKVRTSKAVRIRGLSATATAALGCLMGWGDAASQMLVDPAGNPPAGLRPFGPPFVDPGPAVITGNTGIQLVANTTATNEALLAAAEEVELPAGWRGTLIDNLRREFDATIKDVAAPLSTDLVDRWLDGMSDKDVKEFGERAGRDLTNRAVSMFNAAASAVQPRPDEAQTTGDQNP